MYFTDPIDPELAGWLGHYGRIAAERALHSHEMAAFRDWSRIVGTGPDWRFRTPTGMADSPHDALRAWRDASRVAA